MSQRTESPTPDKPELSNEYLISLVVAAAVVLLFIFVLSPLVSDPIDVFKVRHGAIPWLYGWVLAAGQTIANGLAEFSGEALKPVDGSFRLSALLSLWFLGIIGPTLFLLLMRGPEASPLPPGGRGLYLIGMVICATFAISILPAAYKTYAVRVSLRSAQAVQENKDHMVNDLNVIAWKVREHRILPKRSGGGEGSTKGFELPTVFKVSAEAAYTVTPTATGAAVEASSKLYKGAKITLTIDGNGRMSNWTYFGDFE
jgi:hypothetical protein